MCSALSRNREQHPPYVFLPPDTGKTGGAPVELPKDNKPFVEVDTESLWPQEVGACWLKPGWPNAYMRERTQLGQRPNLVCSVRPGVGLRIRRKTQYTNNPAAQRKVSRLFTIVGQNPEQRGAAAVHWADLARNFVMRWTTREGSQWRRRHRIITLVRKTYPLRLTVAGMSDTIDLKSNFRRCIDPFGLVG